MVAKAMRAPQNCSSQAVSPRLPCCATLNHAVRPQRGDLVLAVARLGKDLFGMLAGFGGRPLRRELEAAELQRQRQLGDISVGGMMARRDHAASQELLVLQGLLETQHRANAAVRV